ncbi:zf-HC2 domain-containing protein [Mesobacillus maritimus]|uniref:zf-HC2 domain-containing protein n=1 Tax=Mesobacillus maritimus TaxID=1643336 RepID=UPI0020417B20|nr:zf-HC2 domain-containing protein [Mesobacillus maritimus]MCM3671030.1 zf-HC2 domain-containing protein [Mesobacillus maritimus]
MKKDCSITQDLLPLYEEELLQQETKQFVDEHLQSCQECRQIAEQSQISLAPKVKPGLSSKKMIREVTMRVTTIQIFFVALAFLLAMSTSNMNGSVGFVLTYTLLGTITYLFYRSMILAFFIAAVPTFLWSCLMYMTDLLGNFYTDSLSEAIGIVLITFVVHMLFTIIGIAIGFCIRKILEENQ